MQSVLNFSIEKLAVYRESYKDTQARIPFLFKEICFPLLPDEKRSTWNNYGTACGKSLS